MADVEGKKMTEECDHYEGPMRTRLLDERRAITHKFTIVSGDVRYNEVKFGDRILFEKEIVDLNGYLTVGLYPDGSPGELFLKIGKPGGMWAVYDALAIAISVGLQYGIPADVFSSKFENMRFDPGGITKNEDIPMAKSIVDFLARWMKMKFPVASEEAVVLNSTGGEDGKAALKPGR